jgi:hypothetical protein
MLQPGIGLFSCNIRYCARNKVGAAFETLNVVVWKYMRQSTAAGLSLSEQNGIPHRFNQDNEMAG